MSSRAPATLVEPNRFAPEEILDLPAEPACGTCRIELGEPFELVSDEADGAMPGGLGALDRLADGRFAAAFWGMAPIYVFAADGALESTIGREGSGPGEFRGIGNGLFANGSMLYAFDASNGRLNVIDGDTGEVVEEGQVRGNIMNAAFPASGVFVTSGRGRGSAEPGYPIHVFDRTGSPLRSFGSAEPYDDLGAWSLNRYLASSGDGTFWAASTNELVLEQWTVEGRRLRAFAGQRERFAAGEYDNFTEEGRPSSRVYGIAVDGQGLLWALYAVATVDWRENAEILSADEARARGVLRTTPLPGRRIRDAILEVIDPAAGVVLAREMLPEFYFSFVGPGMLVRGFDDPVTENSRLEVVEVRLVGR